MTHYSAAAMERTMKLQEVILRALAKRITWWQAAEIIGISDRQMRRWKVRYEQDGYDGLWDRRRQSPSPRRVCCCIWMGASIVGFKTTVARGLCTSAPMPWERAIGMNPRLATSAVSITGQFRP